VVKLLHGQSKLVDSKSIIFGPAGKSPTSHQQRFPRYSVNLNQLSDYMVKLEI